MLVVEEGDFLHYDEKMRNERREGMSFSRARSLRERSVHPHITGVLKQPYLHCAVPALSSHVVGLLLTHSSQGDSTADADVVVHERDPYITQQYDT